MESRGWTMIEEIKQYELLYSANQYNGNGSSTFLIEEGTVPVMVSAPHAVRQFREGRMKKPDLYTGGIAQYLHKVSGCHMISSSKFGECDANYDPVGTNQYQASLKKYLDEHNVKVLLDLHGADRSREYAVELGTAPKHDQAPGISCEEDPSLHEYKFIAGFIKSVFEERFAELDTDKKEIWKNQIFDAGKYNTVTKFISDNTSTACIQLEINGNYRDPKNESMFRALIESLVRIIDSLARIDWDAEDVGSLILNV